MIGLFFHDIFIEHLKGYPHVESPERLRSILERVRSSPVAGQLTCIEPEPAERAWIERVHHRRYVEGILSLEVTDAVVLDWGDTVATPKSIESALRAAGAAVQAVRLVHDGSLSSAFCAVRPPGHHAEANRAMGFCIFNNIAIAAADLIDEGGLSKVAIIDWDVHHGNGTERIFIEDDRVLYISLHQYPHYPGTGHPETVGKGNGRGFNINIPMGSGAGDREYLAAFHNRVLPALDEFGPEFMLISAGFDAHGNDPLSGCSLTSAAYGEMTRMLRDAAERHCNGRIVSTLEGGYDLDALAESVEEHLKALA
jgi:acetoin utilization deacetylase AcuC-like enzyme